MLGGPDSNTDAFERKQVYMDMLKKNNLPPWGPAMCSGGTAARLKRCLQRQTKNYTKQKRTESGGLQSL